MATAKRPRRAAGDAPAKAAGERATPLALPETSDTHNAPTLTMAADAPASEQLAAGSVPVASVPATPAATTPAPAAAKQVADGPTLIQPAAPASDTPRPAAPARSTPEAVRAATAQSLASERAAMMRRRALITGALAVLVVAGGLLAYQILSPKAPAAPLPLAQVTSAPTTQPTAAPAAQAQPTAAPVAQVQPTAAPAAQAQPTAAPAAQAQPTAAPAAVACAEIAGLPVFSGATCIEHDTDQDNGVTQIKNTYRTNSAAGDVGRFYEGSFGSNGWTLQEFTYAIDLGARRLKVEVDVEQGASGPVTQISLTERGAPAGARTTCTAIDGLPAYANATCSDFDTDQKDGMLEAKNTYTTSASLEEVRSFYASALKQSGWAVQEFDYGLTQGQRQLKVEIDPKTAVDGAYTQIKVSAK